jgi:hypothetical protein
MWSHDLFFCQGFHLLSDCKSHHKESTTRERKSERVKRLSLNVVKRFLQDWAPFFNFSNSTFIFDLCLKRSSETYALYSRQLVSWVNLCVPFLFSCLFINRKEASAEIKREGSNDLSCLILFSISKCFSF